VFDTGLLRFNKSVIYSFIHSFTYSTNQKHR